MTILIHHYHRLHHRLLHLFVLHHHRLHLNTIQSTISVQLIYWSLQLPMYSNGMKNKKNKNNRNLKSIKVGARGYKRGLNCKILSISISVNNLDSPSFSFDYYHFIMCVHAFFFFSFFFLLYPLFLFYPSSCYKSFYI